MIKIYATLDDLESRHPAELINLAADEQTGLRDDTRIQTALEDASIEVRTILKERYESSDLDNLDEESLEILKIYTIPIALYKLSVSFSRGNEDIDDNYKEAIKRLEAIASGKGALKTNASSNINSPQPAGIQGSISQNEVLIDVPGRVFSRDRLGGL